MPFHALLTENARVKAAQIARDQALQASRDLDEHYRTAYGAWEGLARAAVRGGKDLPPHPPTTPSPEEINSAQLRIDVAKRDYEAAVAEVADDVEAEVFARHDAIMAELGAMLAVVRERSSELSDLGLTATRVDVARDLRTGPGGRQHLSARLDPVDLLKHVERGAGFLDFASSTPSMAGGSR